jgi:4,5-DOPA dioxygenase extradiol
MKKMLSGDNTLLGWEPEYDAWIKKQIDTRSFKDIINYQSSHPLGKLAAPTPDHFVPVLYSLGLMDPNEPIDFFYDHNAELPAFSERSFIIGNA